MNDSEKMKILMTIGDFELCTISKVTVEGDKKTYTYLPPEEGLTIKVRDVTEDGRKIFVPVAFVRPHKDGTAHYESYGDRIEHYCDTWDKVRQFRKLLAEAYDTISSIINSQK